MAEVKKINVGAALNTPLALAHRGGSILSEQFQKHAISEKFSTVKEHPTVTKISKFTEIGQAVLGVALIFHGAQFKNLFLCTQVMYSFCYDRVKGSTLSVYSDAKTAWEKMNEDEPEDASKADAKAEAKPEGSKHAQKRAAKKDADKPSAQQAEEAAAATKKLLKVMDSDKVVSIFFELCVSFMACHMVMQGGMAKVVVVTHALVKATKEKLVGFLDFSEHEDMEEWTNLLLTFVLYVFFGAMAIVAGPLAFALNIAMVGATIASQHGLIAAENMGRIPGGLSAEAFATSTKGLALLGGLTAFGTLWQFWALVSDSGMAFYFKLCYLPVCIAEAIISLF